MTDIPKEDLEFDQLVSHIQETITRNIRAHGAGFFKTRAIELNEIYLGTLAAEKRKEHNCQACLSFIESFGNLVVIDRFNNPVSLLWDEEGAPESYRSIVQRFRQVVEKARVCDAYFPHEATWGTPESDGYLHFHYHYLNNDAEADWSPSDTHRQVYTYDDAFERMVQTREDYRLLMDVFLKSTARQELEILARKSPTALERQAFNGLLVMQRNHLDITSRAKRVCYVYQIARGKNSIEDTLLTPKVIEALKALLNRFESTSLEGYSARMEEFYENLLKPSVAHEEPLIYEGDTEENLQRVIAEHGLEESMQRRYARIDEIPILWGPRQTLSMAERRTPEGVLDISWVAFRNMLGTALKIEVLIPEGPVSNFVAVTAPSNPKNAPVFKWDRPELRNPLSWYGLQQSTAQFWRLKPGNYSEVSAISLSPNLMYGVPSEVAKPNTDSAIFYLKDARPMHRTELGFFDNVVQPFFKPVLNSLRKYSQAHYLSDNNTSSACGVILGAQAKGRTRADVVRLTTTQFVAHYRIVG